MTAECLGLVSASGPSTQGLLGWHVYRSARCSPLLGATHPPQPDLAKRIAFPPSPCHVTSRRVLKKVKGTKRRDGSGPRSAPTVLRVISVRGLGLAFDVVVSTLPSKPYVKLFVQTCAFIHVHYMYTPLEIGPSRTHLNPQNRTIDSRDHSLGFSATLLITYLSLSKCMK